MLRKIAGAIFGIILAMPLAVQAEDPGSKSQSAATSFCFEVSKICIPVARPSTAVDYSEFRQHQPFDLTITPEDMLRLVSELNAQIGDSEDADTHTVEVTAPTPVDQSPSIPGGLGSLFWAVGHPTQAWRIFMPVPRSK